MWLLDFPYLKRRLVEFRKREEFLIVTQTFNHAMNGKVWNSIKNCILSSYLQHPLRKLKLVQLLDTNSRILALLFAQSLKSLRTKSHKITWNVLKKTRNKTFLFPLGRFWNLVRHIEQLGRKKCSGTAWYLPFNSWTVWSRKLNFN